LRVKATAISAISWVEAASNSAMRD
jgi:hypothetical protein